MMGRSTWVAFLWATQGAGNQIRVCRVKCLERDTPLLHLCMCQLVLFRQQWMASSHKLSPALTLPGTFVSIRAAEDMIGEGLCWVTDLESEVCVCVGGSVWMPHHYRAFMANCSILTPGASFPFPQLYYRTHKIALDVMIAIGTVHPSSPAKSFFKTNVALKEILLTRRSNRFRSLCTNGNAQNPIPKNA